MIEIPRCARFRLEEPRLSTVVEQIDRIMLKTGQEGLMGAKRTTKSPQSFWDEFKKQIIAALVTALVALGGAAFLPESIKNSLRYGLPLLLEITFASKLAWAIVAIGIAAVIALRLRFRISRYGRGALAVGFAAITGALLQHNLSTPTQRTNPTIAVFGFFGAAEDGSLIAVPNLNSARDTLVAELTSQKREHPCLAKSVFEIDAYSIHPFYLSRMSRTSFGEFVKQHYPDAVIGLWAFVNVTGNIEEFHVEPLVQDLVNETTTSDQAARQLTQAFNRDAANRLTAVRFGGRTLAAIFGNATSTVFGENDKDMPATCAAYTLSVLRSARALLQHLPGFESDVRAHQQYWDPALLVMRAVSRRSAQRYDMSVALYSEAAAANPLFPYGTREDYAAALRLAEIKDNISSEKSRQILGADSARVGAMLERLRSNVPQPYGLAFEEPVLISLKRVLFERSDNGEGADGVFSRLTLRHPNEPVVWMHWGDVYWERMQYEAGMAVQRKLPTRMIDREISKSLLAAIEKYEKAVQLDASFSPARIRLSTSYTMAFKIMPNQQERWIRKLDQLAQGSVR